MTERPNYDVQVYHRRPGYRATDDEGHSIIQEDKPEVSDDV